MQLKIRRSQRDAGTFSKSVIFAIDVRAEYTPVEKANIQRYKLHKEVVYNSEKSRKHLDNISANVDRGSYFSAMASAVLSQMNLNITVESLERGHHIECKTLDELLSAEEQLIGACQALKHHLDLAATFDGREVVVSFDTEEPEIVAEAQPMLATPQPAPAPAAAPAPQPPPPAAPVLELAPAEAATVPTYARAQRAEPVFDLVSTLKEKLPKSLRGNAREIAFLLYAVAGITVFLITLRIFTG